MLTVGLCRKVVCECGYTREQHVEEAIRPHAFQGQEWDPKRHVQERPTDAFGDIVFTGLGQKVGKVGFRHPVALTVDYRPPAVTHAGRACRAGVGGWPKPGGTEPSQPEGRGRRGAALLTGDRVLSAPLITAEQGGAASRDLRWGLGSSWTLPGPSSGPRLPFPPMSCPGLAACPRRI